MHRRAIAFHLAALAVVLLAACRPEPPVPAPTATLTLTAVASGTAAPVATTVPAPTAIATPTPIPPGLLRVNMGMYPDTTDPQRALFPNEIATLRLIYEGLTRVNEHLETVPGAADHWEYNADATVLTFHIRDGLQYSDGTPLNAKRFEFALQRNIDPETAGELAAITDEIVGAVEWRSADTEAEGYDAAALKAAVGVTALDGAGQPCLTGASGYAQEGCRTLQIALRQPAPYFHSVLSMIVSYPAKEENIVAGGETWWNSSDYHVGNGPFIMVRLEPFVFQRFTPNPRYWRGRVKYDLEYWYISDRALALTAYAQNDIDITGYDAETVAQINAKSEFKSDAHLYPGACTYGLMFSLTREPFTDRKVREAFALAIDRDAWVRDILDGLGAPALSWIPPGYPGYDPDERRFAFDVEKAKATLDESSYGGAAGLPDIKWTFGDTPRGRTHAEWFAAQFQNTLGVTVTLDPIEPMSHPMPKDKPTAPLAFLLAWCANYPDPHDWLSVYRTTGTFGELIRYSNPALDALLDQADSTVDPAQRLALYMQAEDLLLEDVPVAPLYHSVNACLIKPWVKGLEFTPQDEWCGSNEVLSIRVER